MRKALIIIALMDSALCLLLPLLLVWGYPLGMNRLWFKEYKEQYPGPVSLTVSSFPFGVYCPELFNNVSFKETYSYRNLVNHAIDIPCIFYNRDTLIFFCGKEELDTVSFFRVTNPIKGHECEDVQFRIEKLKETPEASFLLEHGYTMKKLYWKGAMTSYILEPVFCFLFLSLSIVSVLLCVIQFCRPRLQRLSAGKGLV